MELKRMCTVALAFVATSIAASDLGAQHAAVDSLVAAEALDRGVPAVAVAIVADGEVVIQRAWGVADAESRRAATGNVDDPDRATYEARLDTASASAPPGERFEYSNTGYTVLGWLVSEVEGAPLADVLRRRLFEPLGMTQARYRASLADDPLRALPHALDDGEPRPADYVTGGFGSGGMSMSAADAAAFALALQEGRFLTAGLVDTVWTSARLGDGTEVDLDDARRGDRRIFGEPLPFSGRAADDRGAGQHEGARRRKGAR